MIKRSIKEEGTALVNKYSLNTAVFKYIKQISTDIKEETESNKIIISRGGQGGEKEKIILYTKPQKMGSIHIY